MIVADTNLVVQLTLRLAQTEQARNVYQRDSDWVLPELWRHEYLNVLANYLRFDHTPMETLLAAWQQATSLFKNSVKPVDMLQALRLAGDLNISAYDAQYLALAQTFDIKLVTEDRKLRKAAPDMTLSMQALLSGN
jgi:predicted nucleic acid-binding protein